MKVFYGRKERCLREGEIKFDLKNMWYEIKRLLWGGRE